MTLAARHPSRAPSAVSVGTDLARRAGNSSIFTYASTNSDLEVGIWGHNGATEGDVVKALKSGGYVVHSHVFSVASAQAFRATPIRLKM